MPTHKTPLSPLSLNQLCELTGQTYRTIKKKLAPLDPEEEDGRTLLYNTRDALELIYSSRSMSSRPMGAYGDEGEDGVVEFIDAQYQSARLTRAKADHLEFDLAKKRGEVIAIADVEKHWADLLIAFRSQLRNLPDKLAHRLMGTKNVREATVILKEEIDQALSELNAHGSQEDLGVDEAGDEEGEAAAEADDLSVGGSISSSES